MRRIFWVLALMAGMSTTSFGYESAQGWCEKGGIRPTTAAAATFQASYPLCTVTVYVSGTATLATIYSDNAATPTPIPGGSFTATTAGHWQFYALNGSYDVVLSGGTPSPGVSPPFTVSAVVIGPTTLDCAKFPGPTGGEKWHQCMVALSSNGGVADARLINGVQSVNTTDPFSGITKSVTLIVSGAVYGINTPVTSPSNVQIVAMQGAIFSVAAAQTLTVNGSLAGSALSQHFSGDGTATLKNSASVYPQWWGCDLTDSSDDTACGQSAFDSVASGGTVVVTGGTLRTSVGFEAAGNYTKLKCEGGATILGTTILIRVFRTFNFDHGEVSGCHFKGTGKDTGTSSGQGLVHVDASSEYWDIHDNFFDSASGSAFVDDGAGYTRFHDNYVDTTGEHCIYSSSPTGSVYADNILLNCGAGSVLVPPNGAFGIKLDGSTRVSVVGGYISMPTGSGPAINTSATTTQVSISGITINYAGADSAISISGGTASGLTIQGMTVLMNGTASTKAAVEITQALNSEFSNSVIYVSSNSFCASFTTNTTFTTFSNNKCVANASVTLPAINVVGVDDNRFFNNEIIAGTGTWALGVFTNSTADRNDFVKNKIAATAKYSTTGRDNRIDDIDYDASVTTTDATVTQIFAQTLAGAGAYLFTARVTGQTSGGANRASYVRETLIYGNGATVQGTTNLSTIESDAAWDVTIDASGDDYRIRVTGAAATTINWTAKVDWLKVP